MPSDACEMCRQAAAGPWHGFDDKCKGCRARAAARTPFYSEARQAGKLTPAYRTLLERLGVTHDDVKAAEKADRLGKGKDE